MSVTSEILQAYRGFGAAMRRQLAKGVGEEGILAYGVVASIITFAARTPSLIDNARVAAAAAEEDVTWVAIFVTNMVTTFFFGVLLLYGIAALSHLVAKLVGGKGSFYSARLALFWSALVVAPVSLLATIVKTIAPFPAVYGIATTSMFLLFLYAWITALVVAEKPAEKN